MTTKIIEEVFRKVLNDTDIFDSPHDRNARLQVPKLFEKEDWRKLGRLFNEIQELCREFSISIKDIRKLKNENRLPEELNRKIDEFESKINTRIREIENFGQQYRLQQSIINKLKKRAEWLKSALDKKPYLLQQLFENLEWYGLVKCKLPNMDSYGKVIERYEISIVEEYFVDKIKRSSYPQKKALEKMLEYVKELYAAGVPPEKIAYFVRKVNSLTTYWEVIE